MTRREHSTITTLSRDTRFRVPVKKSKSFTPMNRNTRFFRERRRRRVRFVSILIRTMVVAVVVLIVGTIAVEIFKLEHFKLPDLPDLPPIISSDAPPSAEQVQTLIEQNTGLRNQNAALQSEIASYSGLMTQFQDQLRELSDTNAQLKTDLTYAQRMVAEATRGEGLVVRDVRVTPPARKKGEWRYRILLVQGGSPKSDFEGVVRISLQGRGADGTWLGPLKYEPSKPIPIKFRGYERIEKTIVVPEGQPAVRRFYIEVFKVGVSKPVAVHAVEI